MTVATARQALPVIDLAPPAASFADDVAAGLRKDPPQVPCKYFYDQRGSQLFDRICELEEYYLTRTETQIMEDHAPEIASAIGENALLIEYGSGSSRKTRILLDTLDELSGYVPIDISREHLQQAADKLAAEYADLWVQPVCADYTRPITLPDLKGGRRVVYFPGSTIGNFPRDEARELLGRMRELAGETGSLLVGVDLKKDPEVLHAAYNDRQGVTAEFNKNILSRIQAELDESMEAASFAHRAIYGPAEGCIEMRLVCRKNQRITVGAQSFFFEPGDYIRTERSYKYTVAEFAGLAREAGLKQQHVWMDARNYFSVQYFSTTA